MVPAGVLVAVDSTRRLVPGARDQRSHVVQPQVLLVHKKKKIIVYRGAGQADSNVFCVSAHTVSSFNLPLVALRMCYFAQSKPFFNTCDDFYTCKKKHITMFGIFKEGFTKSVSKNRWFRSYYNAAQHLDPIWMD